MLHRKLQRPNPTASMFHRTADADRRQTPTYFSRNRALNSCFGAINQANWILWDDRRACLHAVVFATIKDPQGAAHMVVLHLPDDNSLGLAAREDGSEEDGRESVNLSRKKIVGISAWDQRGVDVGDWADDAQGHGRVVWYTMAEFEAMDRRRVTIYPPFRDGRSSGPWGRAAQLCLLRHGCCNGDFEHDTQSWRDAIHAAMGYREPNPPAGYRIDEGEGRGGFDGCQKRDGD